jgi:hypothetical protein
MREEATEGCRLHDEPRTIQVRIKGDHLFFRRENQEKKCFTERNMSFSSGICKQNVVKSIIIIIGKTVHFEP